MKMIEAKILDPTHLELSQPIGDDPGKLITIAVPEDSEEDRDWHRAAKEHFLKAYDEQDAVYDNL